MATTLKASGVATFNNGASYSDDSPVVGYRSAGTPRIIRYTFTTPASGASSYSVMISGCSKLDGDCTQLKCYLTTSTDSHKVATSAYTSDAVLSRRATTTGYGQYEFYSGTITKSLAGSTTYYLWVFAASETKPLSMFLPKTGNQYSTDLATITVNEGSGGSTTTGTTVSTSAVSFTGSLYTDSNHPYTLIARVQETSSNSSSVTFSLKVYLTSYTSGAGYEYTYGNRLDIKVNNSSLYYSDNITNGSYTLDINYGTETLLWSGSFTLNRGTNGKAGGVVYVNFCQTQTSRFNATIQENIISTQATGSVTKAPSANSLTYNGSAQALVSAGTGTGTMYYRLGTSGSFSTSIPTATNAGTYYVYYYSASTTYYTQSGTGGPVTVTIGKKTGSVSTAPSKKTLTYNGSAQTLINAGYGTGTMYYSTTSASSGFSTTLPSATNAFSDGTVWYYAEESTNYTRSAVGYITGIGINRASGWVTLSASSGSITYGNTGTFTINSSHGGTLAVSSSSTTVATVSRSSSTVTMTSKQAGSATITVTCDATTNYTSASATYDLTVNKASGSVTTAPKAKSLTYTGSAQTLINAGYGTGTMYYSTTSASSGFSTTLPSKTTAGTYTVWYYSDSNTNYYKSSVGSIPVTIDRASGWVTLSASSGSTTYGTNKLITVSSSHGGTLSVSSNDTSVATVSISGSTVTIVPKKKGTATITVSSAITTNHYASSSTYALTVERATGWVTLSKTSDSVTYGSSTSFSVSSHHGGTLSISSNSDSSVATASLSGSTITVTPKKSGSTKITVTSATTDQYNSASSSCTITVNRASGWISLSETSGTVIYGTTKTFTVSNHHGGTLSASSSNNSVATASVSGSTVTITPQGNGVATLTVTSATTGQYNSSSATYEVTVHAGLLYIEGVAYQAFLDNGSSWDLMLPYIDNGSSWDLY